MNRRISNIMKINKEKAALEYGYSLSNIEIKKQYKRKRIIRSNKVGEMLMNRKISIQNEKASSKQLQKNKMIIDYTKEYTNET